MARHRPRAHTQWREAVCLQVLPESLCAGRTLALTFEEPHEGKAVQVRGVRPALQIHFQLLASPEAAAVSRKTVQVTKVQEELAVESLHGPSAKLEHKCGKS